jgi:molybdopterin-synthase adenylyltransferase
VAQQLAHIGVGNFVLVDEDGISLTNLNRLIGGTWWYVLKQAVKVEIMKRMITMSTAIALSRIHFPVTTLGPGRRIGVRST